MKHADRETLAKLETLLAELRALRPLVERTPGAFYLKSKAFLHFHDDPSGLYADVKLDLQTFTRMRVSTSDEQARLLRDVRARLGFFAYRVRKSGDVEVLHHGALATTLRGAAAVDFIAEIGSCEPPAAQQLMARVTGNYKRGNERLAASHPRNRR